MKKEKYIYNPITGRWELTEEEKKKKRLLAFWLFGALGLLAVGALATGLTLGLKCDDEDPTIPLTTINPSTPFTPPTVTKEIDFEDPESGYTFGGEGDNNKGEEIKEIDLKIFGTDLTFSEEKGDKFPKTEGEEVVNEVTIPNAENEDILYKFTFKRVNGIVKISKVAYEVKEGVKIDDSNKQIITDFKEKEQTKESSIQSTKYQHSNKVKIKFQINGVLVEEDIEVQPTTQLKTEKEITKKITVKPNDETEAKEIEVKIKLTIQPTDEKEKGTKESPVTFYTYDAVATIVGGSEEKYTIEGFEETTNEEVDSNGNVTKTDKENNGLFSKQGTYVNEYLNPFIYAYDQIAEKQSTIYNSISKGLLESELADIPYKLYETETIRDIEGGISGYNDTYSDFLENVIDFDSPELSFTKEELIEARKGLNSKEKEETLSLFGSQIYEGVDDNLYHIDKVFGDNNKYTARLFFTYGHNYNGLGDTINPDLFVETKETFSKYLIYGLGIALNDGTQRTTIETERSTKFWRRTYDNIANYGILNENPVIYQQFSRPEGDIDPANYQQIGNHIRIIGEGSDDQNVPDSYYSFQIERDVNGDILDKWTTEVGAETEARDYRIAKSKFYGGFPAQLNPQTLNVHPLTEIPVDLVDSLDIETINECLAEAYCNEDDDYREYSTKIWKATYMDPNTNTEKVGFVTRMLIKDLPYILRFMFVNPTDSENILYGKVLDYAPSR